MKLFLTKPVVVWKFNNFSMNIVYNINSVFSVLFYGIYIYTNEVLLWGVQTPHTKSTRSNLQGRSTHKNYIQDISTIRIFLLIQNYIITQQIGSNKLLLITLAVDRWSRTTTLLNVSGKGNRKESITNFQLRACSLVIMLCVMNYLNY